MPLKKWYYFQLHLFIRASKLKSMTHDCEQPTLSRQYVLLLSILIHSPVSMSYYCLSWSTVPSVCLITVYPDPQSRHHVLLLSIPSWTNDDDGQSRIGKPHLSQIKFDLQDNSLDVMSKLSSEDADYETIGFLNLRTVEVMSCLSARQIVDY